MRKVLRLILSLMLVCLAAASVACGNGDDGLTFSGLEEVRISTSQQEYDFLEGVNCIDQDGNVLEVTVDTSKVSFGTAGQYTVTYRTEKGSRDVAVYIYGTPTIETTEFSVDYATANDPVSLAEKVTAKDSFGNACTVTMKGTLAVTASGALQTGAQNIVFSATDAVGNVAEKEVQLEVVHGLNLHRKMSILLRRMSHWRRVTVSF